MRRKGDNGENLVGILESRLDAIVYRMKFAVTPFAARQFVNHGHVRVNGQRVDIPSYLCKEGDLIEVTERARNIPMVMECLQQPERDVPEYMQFDFKGMKGQFVRTPKMADVPYPVQMEPNLVIEYYSR
jgi:small subunit ribosomal protein S4